MYYVLAKDELTMAREVPVYVVEGRCEVQRPGKKIRHTFYLIETQRSSNIRKTLVAVDNTRYFIANNTLCKPY